MNIDLASTFDFGNTDALRTFMAVHRSVHDATSAALSAKYAGSFSTFGLSAGVAEGQWIEIMRTRRGPMPEALNDWLRYHAQIHNATYARLAGTGTVAPDLSVVDFSKETEFYDWMYVHQQMHDYEQDALGIQ